MYICRPLVYLEFVRTDIIRDYSIIEILGKNKVNVKTFFSFFETFLRQIFLKLFTMKSLILAQDER
tara:strand:+ start:28 stop:225 length:198 start_codon:yes stop_codon:yes gene_type:complete